MNMMAACWTRVGRPAMGECAIRLHFSEWIKAAGVSLIAISAMLISGTACAQGVSPSQAGHASSDRVGAGEIIVTAQRREESVHKIPISISALSGDQLRGMNIRDVADLTRVVPGFASDITRKPNRDANWTSLDYPGPVSNGYTLRTAGDGPDGSGYLVAITFVDNPPNDARIVEEAQFGPVLPIMKFSLVDEAVACANASDYGLAGSVWSKDEKAALAIAERLETGTVRGNEALHMTPFTSFGGHKQSGMGVENGIDGMLEYSDPQTIALRKAERSEV